MFLLLKNFVNQHFARIVFVFRENESYSVSSSDFDNVRTIWIDLNETLRL